VSRFLRSKAVDVRAYFASVADLLAGEFDWDTHERAAFEHAVTERALGRDSLGGMSYICDSPASARFRLRDDHNSDDPFALRMAFYPVAPNNDPQAPGAVRAQAITDRMRDLLAAARSPQGEAER
jgi:hypothetical protein